MTMSVVLRFAPFHVPAHKSSACNACTTSAALRLIRRMLTSWITLAAFVLFIPATQCSNDSPFSLSNKATGFCLLKKYSRCLDLRWTTGNRIFVTSTKKCLGAQGKSVGSEVNIYDCDDKSALQKWECRNETLLALKDQQLYIEVKADESIALSRTVGPNNHLTITGTSSGACTRTHRELYTIEGNAFGKLCMFPFFYKDRWFGDCTTFDSSTKRNWCAVETKFEREQWGYCPTSSTEHWSKNLVTGAYYQLNTQSALTWAQAESSCKQQTAALLSVVDPSEQAFVSALLGSGKSKLWLGLVLDPEHGWQWSDGKPFRYLRWDTGNPLPNPGHNCAFLNSAGQHNWQSSSCGKKLGYICYKDGTPASPPQTEQGFCSNPWIPYNGHCFHLHRTTLSWPDAQRDCRKEGGDLVSIRNVEDQSFVISQLGYASTDELWIGLNDRKTEGLFDWSDHSTVSFTSWEYGKPAVATEGEDCVLIRGENGNWADRSCDEKHGYICMKQSSTESKGDEIDLDIGCKAGWKRHGSYCYFVGSETKTFDAAKDDCKSSGSYLADVANGVDNAFLVSLVGLRPEKHFWLGLSNQKNFDVFEWTNTDMVRFTHWNTEMPGYRQGCVAMTTGVLAGLWDLLPCDNKEKYICKHLAEGAVFTAPPPTQIPPQCADGWNRVGTRSICSKFFTGPRSHEKTWFEARDYCRAIGGDLLSIHSAAELRVHYRGGKGWIGLHIADTNVGFVWSDGSPLNYQHWQEGEPNNLNNVEHCAEFLIHNWDEDGSWNDANCDLYNDWLCQIRAGVTPKPPPNDTAVDYNTTSDGWLEWRGNHYYINRMSKSVEEARTFCQRRHGDLASVNSKEENAFLWKQISRTYGAYYIGLSVDLDRSFWWMDGTPVSFQKWDDEQPNSNAFDENCVVMTYYMGFWRTTNCGRETQFICKRRSTSPVNSTLAPTVTPQGGCGITWAKFGSKCYNVISDRKTTWEEARKQCVMMRGNLVSIPTRSVQAFLTTKLVDITATDLWIGLNAVKQDGFYWTDGKSRKYTNWGYSKHQRRPGTFYQRWNEEDCVVMTTTSTLGIGKWMVKSCNDTSGFICHKNLDPNIQSPPDTIDPNIYVRVGNDSIKVVTQNLTWYDAKRRCESEKANLANLRNEWTQAHLDLVAMNLNAPLWIGLNKNQTGGYFRYVDGWHLNFATWAEYEPSRNKPCVYIGVDGKWRTAFCNQTMNSVCMLSADVAPTESTMFPGRCPEDTNVEYQQSYTWLPFKGHCYLFITDEIEWADAASSCVRHGGTLVSIEEPSEQQFIRSNVEIFQDGQASFWIGLFKTYTGTWMWLDKTVLDYTNWAPEEPESDYGAIRTSDGTWSTGRRWHDRGYICKTPKILSTDPESKPEPHGGQDQRSRVHTSLVVVLIITITSTLMVVAFFLYKKSPRPLPTFENPLYFNSEPSPPDVVDTNKMIENAENPEPILTL
uniref:Mannose receptor, C type 1b n=3 Tax=Amphiprion ocellaris TaxID=80972 RepID=A0AAQ5XL32_AMPOC